MNKELLNVTCAVGIGLGAGQAALAGGFEGDSQFMGPLFEEGSYLELTYGSIRPNVSGTYAAALGGTDTGNIGENYGRLSAAFKNDINDQLSYALIFDQPWQRTVNYTQGAFAGLDGEINSTAITALLRYKVTDRFSVYAGPRLQRVSSALENPPFAYSLDSGTATDFGYAIGAAYEIPEYAVRVALTYNSEINHSLPTTETTPFGTSTTNTDVVTPESFNLEFQAPVSRSTLVFGSIRHVKWDGIEIRPAAFGAATGDPLIDYHNDTTTYRLGVGQKINDQWAVFANFAYEDPVGEEQSALGPTDGFRSIGFGATYNASENLEITAGLSRVTVLGNTGDIGEFGDGTVWAAGLQIGYKF